MGQKQIGEFIQLLRKENNFTQKELAERINVSDKTISKWENGNSTPDTTLLSDLCEALGISVNELLSCEKLPPEKYSKKAEENIMTLLQEKEDNKRNTTIGYIIGGCLIIVGLLLNFGFLPSTLNWFIDLPSLLLPALYCVGAIFLCGRTDKLAKIHIARKTIIPAGVITSLSGLIAAMGTMNDPSKIGPNISISTISLLYVMIAYVILLIIEQHMKKQ